MPRNLLCLIALFFCSIDGMLPPIDQTKVARALVRFDSAKRAFYYSKRADDFVDAYENLLQIRLACAAYWPSEHVAIFKKWLDMVHRDREFAVTYVHAQLPPTGPTETLLSRVSSLLSDFFSHEQDDDVPTWRYLWWMWQWPDLTIFARGPLAAGGRFNVNLQNLYGVGHLSPEALRSTLPNIVPDISEDELDVLVCELVERKVFFGGAPISFLACA